MKTFWGTSFEGEFELFNSEEEATEFQKELGDEDSEYGVVEELVLLKPSELRALLKQSWDNGVMWYINSERGAESEDIVPFAQWYIEQVEPKLLHQKQNSQEKEI